MAKDATEGEGLVPKDPEGGEGAQPNDPKSAGGTAGGEGESARPKDPEGATVNRSKYDADVRRRDKEIASLREQLKALNDGKAAAGDEAALDYQSERHCSKTRRPSFATASG